MKLYIPNILTGFRLVASPIFYVLYFSEIDYVRILSEVLFLVAALTDYFDGWYARKHKVNSKFGAFFDPLADKLLIGTAFFAFMAEGLISSWMVWVVVFRDVMATALRRFLINKGFEMKTSRSAKWKTFTQFLFIGYVMFANFFIVTDLFGIGKVWKKVMISDFTYNAMLGVSIFTIYTLLEYIIKHRYKIWQ